MADLDALWAAHRETRDRLRRGEELGARLVLVRREFGEARSRCHELQSRLENAAAELARVSGVRGLVVALGGGRQSRLELARRDADECRAELDEAEQAADGLRGDLEALDAQVESLGSPAEAKAARDALIAALEAAGDPRAATAGRLSAEIENTDRAVTALDEALEIARAARAALLDASRQLEVAERSRRGSRTRQMFLPGARHVRAGVARSAARDARDAVRKLAEYLTALPSELRAGLDVGEHAHLGASTDWRPGDPERALEWVDRVAAMIDERLTTVRDERDAAEASRDALLD